MKGSKEIRQRIKEEAFKLLEREDIFGSVQCAVGIAEELGFLRDALETYCIHVSPHFKLKENTEGLEKEMLKDLGYCE